MSGHVHLHKQHNLPYNECDFHLEIESVEMSHLNTDEHDHLLQRYNQQNHDYDVVRTPDINESFPTHVNIGFYF